MHRRLFFLRRASHTRTSHKSAASPELHSTQANPGAPKERLGPQLPGRLRTLGEAQAPPEPFHHFLTSLPPHLLRVDSVGPFPYQSLPRHKAPPSLGPGLLPLWRDTERSQGTGWFRAPRSGCPNKLGSDSGWRNVAQGLPGQVRPPHIPRSWQGGWGQSGHSAAPRP